MTLNRKNLPEGAYTYEKLIARTITTDTGCRIPVTTRGKVKPVATSHGYARIKLDGKDYGAHILAWVFVNGPIPENMEPDHLCRNRACCEVSHLELVSRQENLLRGQTIAATHAAKTHCPYGHPFSDENTRIRKSNGARQCRACDREQKRRKYHGL